MRRVARSTASGQRCPRIYRRRPSYSTKKSTGSREGSTGRAGATTLELPANLWTRVSQAHTASVFDSVRQVEDPLRPLLTSTPREDLPRVSQSDVGPEDRGRRPDVRMPPPGPLL